MQQEPKEVYDVIIIGGGPAGLASAIYCSRSKLRTLVLDKNPAASALNLAGAIENYPGIAERVTGKELLSRMRKQAQTFGAQILKNGVISVDFNQAPKLIYATDKTYYSTAVIIATGAMGRKPSIKGEADYIGKGVAVCAACDAALFEQQDVVVAGKPELIEDDLPEIAKFARHVYLIPTVGKAAEQNTLVSDAKIELVSGQITEVLGNSMVSGVRVKDTGGGDRTIDAAGVFLYLQGRIPIVDFVGNAVSLNAESCIAINADNMSCSVDGVFAAGDVTCKKVRQSVVAAAEGCLAAIGAISFVNAQRASKSA